MDTTFGLLHCTLLDRRSSIPLAGARVTCISRAERVSVHTTDEEGVFTAQLPEGVYDLVISARHYLSLSVRGIGILGGYRQDILRGLIPGEGQTLEGEPSTAIAGYVRDRVGQTLGNVSIHVNSSDGRTAYTTRTDKIGAFVLNGVRPGMYDLVARAGERTLALEHVPIAHVKELVRVDLRVLQT
ncbi:MAG TPA: carboxypeptidase-like regulatory domain-containing protein [Candidatus Sulfotelmatobacter sp.]|nr:carboxypeptidase-like regulatory domain-containing protein [Candidatus Sulfotelmatobacter sp.]